MTAQTRLSSGWLPLDTFLTHHQYPHLDDWGPAEFERCLIVRLETVERPRSVFGYVWFHWVAGCDRVMEMHVCIAHPWRTRWLRLAPDLLAILRLCDAQTVLARPDSAVHGRLLRRFGFTPSRTGLYHLSIKENA